MHSMSSTPSLCTQTETIGSLKMDWCGMRMRNARVECACGMRMSKIPKHDDHKRNHGIANMRGMSWAHRNQTRPQQCHGTKLRGTCHFDDAIYNVLNDNNPLHTPPVEKRLLLQSSFTSPLTPLRDGTSSQHPNVSSHFYTL